jgi:hypothetical protein
MEAFKWKVIRVSNITVAQGWECQICGRLCTSRYCATETYGSAHEIKMHKLAALPEEAE